MEDLSTDLIPAAGARSAPEVAARPPAVANKDAGVIGTPDRLIVGRAALTWATMPASMTRRPIPGWCGA